MKKIIYTLICMVLTYCTLFAQNIGIGTTSPSQLLHVKDGNLYLENGEFRLDAFGSKIYRSGANVVVGAQANLRFNPGSVYDVTIQSGGVTYANFEGNSQRFGLNMGITVPSELMHMKDGNLLIENGELHLENSNTRLYNSSNSTYLTNDGHIVFNAGQGSANDGIFFQDNGTTRAKIDNGRLSIGGSFSANESIHTTGAVLMGGAVSSNKGTIQWDGDDFLGATNDGWESLTSVNKVVDTDGDTGINLVESAQDSINFTIDDVKYGQMHRWSDGSHYVDWYGDPTQGAFEKMKHRFFISGNQYGSIGCGATSVNTIEMVGNDRAIMRAAYNDGVGNQTYVVAGKLFSTYGVAVSVGSYPSGSLRAMFDVRGDIECDGAEINDGLTVNDGATINDVMTLTPMPEPATGSAGDVYMDDGSCSSCGGDVRLRFHNGSSWKTL